MKILVDLDPKLVWSIQERAERLGMTPGEVLRDDLLANRKGRETREAVKNRVTAGMPDADIAADLGLTPGHVAEVRRRLGIPPNKRYSIADHCINRHEIVGENRYTDPDGRVRCRACERANNRRRRERDVR